MTYLALIRRAAKVAAAELTMIALAIAAAPTLAHHSFAMFDKGHTITVNGTVKTIEWTNPHVWLWITVPNQAGSSDDWGLESGGPSQMNRMGIKHTEFVTGDKITVEIYPMKDGHVGGQMSKATLANGHHIDVQKSVRAFAAGGQSAGETRGAEPPQ